MKSITPTLNAGPVVAMPHAATSSQRLNAFDGLRALAIVLVLVFHLTPGAAIQPNALGRVLSHPALAPLARYIYDRYIIHDLLMPWYEQTFGPQVLAQYVGGRAGFADLRLPPLGQRHLVCHRDGLVPRF